MQTKHTSEVHKRACPISRKQLETRGSVSADLQQEMAYDESNGHATDHVTRPRKVKFMTPIRLEPNISDTAAYAI